MLAEMTATQIQEWQVYDGLEPFGRPWHQAAMLASILANTNRDPDKRSEPYTVDEILEEFVPGYQTEDDGPILTGPVPLTNINLPAEEPEPQWMQWKQTFQMMADATKPEAGPTKE